jgi:hypothetical protein
MKFYLPPRFFAAALVVLANASLAHAQDIYLVGKTLFYRQTSLTAIGPDPIRPYSFEGNAPINVAIALPSGTPAPITVKYGGEDGDEEGFEWEVIHASKAALDAAFPPGAYRITGTGIPDVTVNLPDSFAIATPQVTQVTNGTWNSGGVLVINPTQASTITFNTFSDYSAPGSISLITYRIWGYTEQDDVVSGEATNQPGFDIPVQVSPLTSIAIPANRLVNNRIYLGTIEFIRVPTADITSVPNAAALSLLTKRLDFFIAAQTNATPSAPPTVTAAALSRTAAAGSSTTIASNVTVPEPGRGNIALLYKNGIEINTSGPRFVRSQNGQSLTINALTVADAGDYMLEVVNAGGVVRTAPATLTIPVVPGIARLSNLSILTTLAAGDAFTMGYVMGGAGTSGTKPLVIRAVGPSLAQVGVTDALDDPKLELFAGTTKTTENDNWGGTSELAAAMAGVGAFAFSSGTSRDAAALASISSSENSVRVSAVGNGSGTVIAELYDGTPGATFTATTPRLVNVSVLKNIGSGLTAGFVIGGSTERTVLIRAIGPTLAAAPFSVSGVVTDPQLSLNTASFQIAQNNDWGGGRALTAAFAQVGAFTLPASSRDAAILATLGPGNYTVQVSGVGNTSGTALVEVYELP